MKIGVLEVSIFIPYSCSLKTKRRIINSIKSKIKNKFNVSIAEDNLKDVWQRSKMYIVGVNSSYSYLEEIFCSIEKFINAQREFEVLDTSLKFYECKD